MTFDLNLFKKITIVEFATDYSTGGFLYPPLFVWPEVGSFLKIEKEIKKIVRDSNIGLGMYVHFPFCRYKCAFCRFYSLANKNPADYDRFLGYLIKELKLWADLIKKAKKIRKVPLETIYLGGGTPTLFNLETFFAALKKDFEIKNCRQINLESTLDAIDEKKLRFYKKVGVGRLLLGIQSLDPRVLKAVGRFPDQRRILEKIYFLARKIGLPSINFELICGLPGQSSESFLRDLWHLINLRPDGIHIYDFLKTPLSVYGLKAGRKNRKALFISSTNENLFRKGYAILEKSGYSFVGDEWIRGQSQGARNLQNAERQQSVIPVGPSAIGNFKKNDYNLRLFNTLNLFEYTKRVKNGCLSVAKYFRLKNRELARSQMICLMIRSAIEKRFVSGEFKEEIAWLKDSGLIEEKKDFFRLKFPTHLEKFVYLKIFYSPKVLKACEKAISERY